MLEAFAGFLERRGYDGTQLPLKSIIATSEALSDRSGSGWSGYSVRQSRSSTAAAKPGRLRTPASGAGFHLMAADLYIELLKENGEPAASG